MAADRDGGADGNRGKESVDRFGAAIGQPVKAGNADKDAEAFVDREIVGKGHQFT